jgi:N,N'-diacetyllegionaminate synthase
MANNCQFIAEIGLNHNGNFGLFYELIKQASLSGADIAKFQLGWRSADTEINALKFEEIDTIIRCCQYHDIEPMFSVFNQHAFEMFNKYNFQSVKIASRTVIEEPELAKNIIGLNKQTFVSLGMWDKDEQPFDDNRNVKYLWCKSLYPTYPWNLTDLPVDFSKTIYSGYSDHSVGIETALLSIARGANVIEKHFTLDKSDTTIRDHALSATPEEFAQLTRIGRAMKMALDCGV